MTDIHTQDEAGFVIEQRRAAVETRRRQMESLGLLVQERDRLKALNAELLKALEGALEHGLAGGCGAPNCETVDRMIAAIKAAKGES